MLSSFLVFSPTSLSSSYQNLQATYISGCCRPGVVLAWDNRDWWQQLFLRSSPMLTRSDYDGRSPNYSHRPEIHTVRRNLLVFKIAYEPKRTCAGHPLATPKLIRVFHSDPGSLGPFHTSLPPNTTLLKLELLPPSLNPYGVIQRPQNQPLSPS